MRLTRIRPKKSLGQNFLRDDTFIRRIIDSLELRADETVVEIGPGQGALTQELVKVAGTVFAIEFDRDLIEPLARRFIASDNFRLTNADALTFDFGPLLDSRLAHPKLVANLPYNISTPILARLIEQRHLFSKMVLMFQREVVERITAGPGGSDRGFLSVLVENAFETEYLFDVPPRAFSPVPKVWSAVVRLTPRESAVENEPLFRRLVSTAFAQKRKTILNNLKPWLDDAAVVLQTCGIEGRRRAETLSLREWASLTGEIKKAGRN